MLLCTVGIAGCGLLPPRHAAIVEQPAAATCQPLVGMPGAEDITIDQAAGVAYVSSTDRRAVSEGRRPVAADGHLGHLFRLDLTQARPVPQDITPPALRSHDFQPHGISLLPLPEGGARLFVINHRRSLDAAAPVQHAIEVLESPSRPGAPWRVLRTITGDALTSPNDIAAVGGDAFYVTNLEGAGSGTGRVLRALAGVNQGNVLYFDGSVFHPPVMALPWANGIAADRSAQLLHIANSGDGMLRTLHWREGHPARPLASATPLTLGSRGDNVEIEPGADGALLVTTHPSLLALIRHSFGSAAAPSLVLRIPRNEGVPAGPVAAIFRSDGDESRPDGLAAASVAALYRPGQGGVPRLLIGAILSERVLLCDLPAPPPR